MWVPTAVSSKPPYRATPRGGLIETALPNETEPWSAKPTRKRLDHRGLLSIDVSSAWYFITVGGFPGVHVAVLES